MRFCLRIYKTLSQLRGKHTELPSLTEAVFENVPARLAERETRPFIELSSSAQRYNEMDKGHPNEVANVKFTTFVKTVPSTVYAPYQFIEAVLEKKQFCVGLISGRRFIMKQVA